MSDSAHIPELELVIILTILFNHHYLSFWRNWHRHRKGCLVSLHRVECSCLREHKRFRGFECCLTLVVTQIKLKAKLLLSGRVPTDPSLDQVANWASVAHVVEINVWKVAVALPTHAPLWWRENRCFSFWSCFIVFVWRPKVHILVRDICEVLLLLCKDLFQLPTLLYGFFELWRRPFLQIFVVEWGRVSKGGRRLILFVFQTLYLVGASEPQRRDPGKLFGLEFVLPSYLFKLLMELT